jgi:hypothetical protein
VFAALIPNKESAGMMPDVGCGKDLKKQMKYGELE